MIISGDKFVKLKAGTALSKPINPNKKQRLKDLLANPDPRLDHQWRDCESKAVSNFAVQCLKCQLYIEQCNSLEVFNRKISNPCAGVVGEIPQVWNVHASHDMLNKGSFYVCSKCLAIVKIAAATSSSILQGPCRGLSRRIQAKTQANSMAMVEGDKSRSIEDAFSGVAIVPKPKATSKAKAKAKSKGQDSTKQSRLCFK